MMLRMIGELTNQEEDKKQAIIRFVNMMGAAF